jgi:hypothetical protein
MKESHIDPKTGKECSGFKYRRDNKKGCLSCSWEQELECKEDEKLPTLKDIKDVWH